MNVVVIVQLDMIGYLQQTIGLVFGNMEILLLWKAIMIMFVLMCIVIQVS